MATDAEANKQRAALAALELVASGVTIGVGTGSTVNLFIDALAANPGRVRSAVSSSQASTARLRAAGIAVVDLNELPDLALYVDGADEATPARHLIKGGGGALTREKILAAAAQRFVCIDRKSTRLNSSHLVISYAVFCLKKKKQASSY